jgi:TatD DNase family protein
MIFDSHAHYDASQFDEDRETLLSSLPEKGVQGVINCADCLESAVRSQKLCEQYPFFYMAAGVHPESAALVDETTLEGELSPFLQYEKTVAVGEIGLDYYYEDACPREKQRSVFETQLEIAKKWDKPVIVHDRDAHADTLALLQKHRPRGVVHCFSGSAPMMKELLKLDLYIGLGGVVTFKNARVPVEVAKEIPLDRLLLETDAPYMAPTPFRGKRNDSSLISFVAEKIGEIRGLSADDVLRITSENTRRLFHI